MRGLKRYRRIIVAFSVVVVLVISMSFTTRERDGVTWGEEVLSEALAPLQRIATVGLGGIRDLYQQVVTLWDLRSINEALAQKVADYEILLNEARELRSENARLRQLFGFTSQNPVTFIPAKVIGRTADQWFSSIIVDKGSSSGVVKDMPVVTGDGLAGRVVRVTPHTSTMMLLTSRDSRVGGLVQRSRDPGIVEGDLEGANVLHIRFFSRDADVMPGDAIVTSGLGQVFPKGLLIGTVVKVGVEEFGLVKYALISPAVNFSRLEEVLILREMDIRTGENEP